MIKKPTELVFFGYCGHHFVLLDVNSPAFQDKPPKAPHQTECLACGEHFSVTLQEIHLGKVTHQERDRGWSLDRPKALMMCSICGGEKESSPFGPNVQRFRCKKCGREDTQGQALAV